MKFDKVKYNNEFNKKAYDRLNIQVPKGKKEIIESHAKSKGYKSLNAYVNALIEVDMKQSSNIVAVVKVASGRNLGTMRKKPKYRIVAQER